MNKDRNLRWVYCICKKFCFCFVLFCWHPDSYLTQGKNSGTWTPYIKCRSYLVCQSFNPCAWTRVFWQDTNLYWRNNSCSYVYYNIKFQVPSVLQHYNSYSYVYYNIKSQVPSVPVSFRNSRLDVFVCHTSYLLHNLSILLFPSVWNGHLVHSLLSYCLSLWSDHYSIIIGWSSINIYNPFVIGNTSLFSFNVPLFLTL